MYNYKSYYIELKFKVCLFVFLITTKVSVYFNLPKEIINEFYFEILNLILM